MAEKIYVNVALSNRENCVCCDENGDVVDCCIVGADFGGMYHPDGINAAQVWAAEHVGLMRTLTNQVSECCAGRCQVSTEATSSDDSSLISATSSLLQEPNDTDADNGESRTIVVDLPLDGTPVTIDESGAVQDDQTVVMQIPEGVITKGGNLSDPGSGEGDEILLLEAGLPESCLDELMGAGLDTPEKVLGHEDLSKIKGIGIKTRDKILRILNEDN
tara:strand:+ start:247 stop:900 length:654 start_codon:yes stop_codon:yes gene_type:complete